MAWTGDAADSTRVTERDFLLDVDGRKVPGVYWTPPEPSSEPQPLVLLGHGGLGHKRIDYIEAMALHLVGIGATAMAIDGPGHGERLIQVPDADLTAEDDIVARELERFGEMWVRGGDTDGVIADWRAALDFIEAEHGPRPTGWAGLSMGTMMGLPVTACEPRIKAAVFGLMGPWGPNAADLTRLAPKVTVPVRFLVQWDDEVVPRDRCFELFDRLGSDRKSLHANPGQHAAVPHAVVGDALSELVGRLAD